MIFMPKPGILYYNRGDIAVDDFTIANTVQDSKYHNLDLSGIIPVGTTAIVVKAGLQHVTPGKWLHLRTAGNVHNNNAFALATQVTNISVFGHGIVVPSADRIVEYRFMGDDWIWIAVNIVGWFA